MAPDTTSRLRRSTGRIRAAGLVSRRPAGSSFRATFPTTLRAATLILFLSAASLLPGSVIAQSELPRIISDSASVELLTVTPGDAVYSAFGHSAFRIRDPVRGMDAVFNYGTFDASDPWFIPKFAYGDMQYFLSVYPTGGLAQGARQENRTVISQRLNLTTHEISDLYQRLLENYRPENRSYLYDFVRDNCSTRLLELIEAEQALVLPDSIGRSETYRELIDGYVHDQEFLDLGIDLVFGARMDRVVFPRERAFLPIDLMRLLDGSTRADNGRPIVASTDTLLVGGGLDLPMAPERRDTTWLTMLLWAGAGIGIALTLIRKLTRNDWTRFRGFADRLLFGVLGFIGAFLLFMWFVSKHTVTQENWNLAWALPTHLWLSLFGFKGWISRKYLKFATFWTWGFLTIYLMDIWIVDITVIPQTIPPAALPLAVLVAWRLARRAFPKKPASELRMQYQVPSRPRPQVNRAVGMPGEVG